MRRNSWNYWKPETSIDPANGRTTIYSYDEDLTDGLGIDLAHAARFTELAARGVTLGANPNGFASAVTNPEGESTVSVQDGLGSSPHRFPACWKNGPGIFDGLVRLN